MKHEAREEHFVQHEAKLTASDLRLLVKRHIEEEHPELCKTFALMDYDWHLDAARDMAVTVRWRDVKKTWSAVNQKSM